MSVHTACDRSAGGDLGLPAAPGRPALSIVARSRQLQPESETSAPEDGAALLRPVGKAGGIDSTYVISACEKPEEEPALRKTSAETDPLKVENSQVTVAVRVRPFSSRETTERSPQVVFLNGDEVAVEHPGLRQVYSFVYDLAFWSVDKRHPGFASQTAVYAALAAPLLQQAFQGYNTCLFAYGQTGSGKSYTMMGFSEEPGIIPRFCEDLFAQVAKKQTQEVCSHHPKCREKGHLKSHFIRRCPALIAAVSAPQLRVREHPTSGPYVEGLSTNVVSSYSDVQVWLELGNKKKATAATGMNDKSSRSHSVLTLVMTQTKTEFVEGEELDHRVRSRVNLVDLAGSERCPMTQTSGERLKEGVSINKSLLTLGKVISALSERAHGKRVFIPYRESVLTWQVALKHEGLYGIQLLKESLSGNSKTAMVATVSPAASSVEETLGALRYATQARAIVNVARVNEDVSARLIRELKAEIEKLQAAQRSSHNIDPERYRLCRQEITSLRMKLHQQERDMADMQRMWKEKFEQAEKRKLQVTKELQKAGITFQMDNHLPNLVNLNEDPQLSEILLYMLKEGTTTVGKRRPSSSHDIQLAGVLIAEDHCTISNVDGTVSITPVGEAKTYINGKLILEPTVLHHEEFLTTYLANILLPCRLEAEIKEAQLKAKEEMMQGIQIVKEMAQQELSSQKAAYESRISALEAELKEESQRKRMQEINNQKATHKIEELEKAKQHFEQEAHASRKRLEMEALATKQALEDHRIRHAKILEALEAEKQRIAKEVQILQQNQSSRDRPLTIQPNWGSMKLSLMIQEANAVSKKLEKNYVFGRHVVPDKGGGSDTCVQVRNLQLGVSTVWSLEKFESKLAAMKELYEVWNIIKISINFLKNYVFYVSQSYSSNRSEDVFCDPADEWEPDITDVPVSSFSRRSTFHGSPGPPPPHGWGSEGVKGLRDVSRATWLIRGASHPGLVTPDVLVSRLLCEQESDEEQKGFQLSARHRGLLSPGRPSVTLIRWLSSVDTGLAGKSGTVYPGSAESPLPGVCRELIGSSLELLGQSYGEENTVADSLVSNLLRICEGILAVSKAHEEQDEDSQCDVFSSGATQLLTVQVASAFEQLVVLTRLWLRGELPGGSAAALPDELRQEVKRLGGCLQLFLQGCSSDISSVVKEAQKQVTQAVLRAVKRVGQLAALRGTELHPPENSDRRAAGGQDDFMDALCDGVGLGLEHLLDSGLEKAEVLARELLRQDTPSEVRGTREGSVVYRATQCPDPVSSPVLSEDTCVTGCGLVVTKRMKASAVGLIASLEHLFTEWKTKSFRTQEENSGYQDLKKMVNLAPEFLKLKRGLEQTIQMTVSALRGAARGRTHLNHLVPPRPVPSSLADPTAHLAGLVVADVGAGDELDGFLAGELVLIR
ncbi:Kinesin-like protein KIF14 [Camelus dromedarius]|uniref:Kinesin-like protein KIF14 n=1 Tax=Camelus dromedarius TaxID=9838 RepID=A0A5N4CIP5_CAMDR|nr:Kinesin-like protein KIF14 [Camelus dromedarius]